MLENLQVVLNFVVNVGIIILIIGILVFIHELGHFVAARLSGMLVEEFSIGFGPKLFSFKRGDTEYMIKLFPLGGYVKILGEAGEEQEWLEAQQKLVNSKDKDTDGNDVDVEKSKETISKAEIEMLKAEIAKVNADPRSFNNKSKKARFFVMIAGVTMNYLLAVLCFYIWLSANSYTIQLPGYMNDFQPTFATKSLVRADDIKYGNLLEGGLAAQVGMPEKGMVKTFNGEELNYSFELREKIEQSAGQIINLNVCNLNDENIADTTSCRDYNLQLDSDGKVGIF
jgi:membrane-associated protease RseP (regulator of RpoE activity)